MTPDTFRRQLDQLAGRGYRGVRFGEAARHQRGRDALLAITFDDAFASVATWAEPILDELGWPGSVFVPTDAVDRQAPLAWLATGRDAGAEYAPLSWHEIERLAGKGWEIGSHSCSHRRLSLLADEDVRRELEVSRRRILDHVDRCSSISYPWGEVDARVAGFARRAGYTSGSGLVGRTRFGDPFAVPREPISASDRALRFRFKTSGVGAAARASSAWPALGRARAVAATARELAPRTGAGMFAQKALSRLWSTRVCIGLGLDVRAFESSPAEDPHLTISMVDPLSFSELPELREASQGSDYLFLRAMERTRLAAAGDLVVARTIEGDFAAAHFLHRQPHRRALDAVAAGLYPPLGDTEVLTEAVYTAPPFRGRGVAKTLLAWTLRALRNAGAGTALAYVDLENARSLRMFAALGYHQNGQMRIDRYRGGRMTSRFVPLTADADRRWRDAVT